MRASGEASLVLGTRKAESQRRARTMAEHDRRRVRERLTPNARKAQLAGLYTQSKIGRTTMCACF